MRRQRLRRDKQPAPTEEGIYYARLVGEKEIEPVLYTQGGRVYGLASDDPWTGTANHDWFGPVPTAREKKSP